MAIVFAARVANTHGKRCTRAILALLVCSLTGAAEAQGRRRLRNLDNRVELTFLGGLQFGGSPDLAAPRKIREDGLHRAMAATVRVLVNSE